MPVMAEQDVGLLRIPAVEPRGDGVALHVGQANVAPRLGRIGFSGVAVRLGAALVGARELLHHADGPLGHGIPREGELVGFVERDIVETELEHRVGQLARRDGHLVGRLDGRAGCFRIGRAGRRKADGFLQRERVGRLAVRQSTADDQDGGERKPAPTAWGTTQRHRTSGWQRSPRRAGGRA